MRRALGAVVLALLGCATEGAVVKAEPPRPTVVEPPVKPPSPVVDEAAAAREVVAQFVAASEKKDFGAAFRLLAAPLRERYTPERLAADFDREPLAAERVQRVKLGLAGSFVIEGSHARLPLVGAKAVELVREDTGWRIAALE